MSRPGKAPLLYQLKLTLVRIRPPIWRRLHVGGEVSLHELHGILQRVLGWSAGRPYEFWIEGLGYGLPADGEAASAATDARHVRLGQVIADRFLYRYDFGAGWEYQVQWEKTVVREEGQRYPVCVKGRRAAPPEDCGGTWGYADLLRDLRNGHGEPDRPRQKYSQGFDPERFCLDDANGRLHNGASAR